MRRRVALGERESTMLETLTTGMVSVAVRRTAEGYDG